MVGVSRLISTISKKIIKPFSPTPSTQRVLKLSLLDQGLTNIYMPLVFFYSKQQLDTIPNGHKQISNILENSLSRTLSYYPPWAGTLRDNTIIDCDDVGAEFLEVKIDSSLDKVLHNPDSTIKDLTFPKGLPWGNCTDRALTVAQLSRFECGGIAISGCLSHKIGDACSAQYFFRDWAALTQDPNAKVSPNFVEDTIIPTPPTGPLLSPVIESEEDGKIQKRFVFSPSKLNALKAWVTAESGVQNPTRNEVVNAMLYRTAALASKTNSGSFKKSQLVQYSNLRTIVSPPLPPSSIGNLLTVFSTPIYDNEDDLKLPKLVADIRKSKNRLSSTDNFKDNEWVSEMVEAYRTGNETYHQRNCVVYLCSSVSNYPFQDLDFGWGKATGASLGIGPFCNIFFLISTQDGGMEALVNLSEEDMSVFENDQHLLEFATPIGQDLIFENEKQQYA